MALDPQMVMWAGIAVAVILLVALAFAMSRRNRRSAELRDRYGDEYKHVVRETGSKAKAAKALREREEHSRQLNIVPLSAADRSRYEEDWRRIEARFIDRPATAVVEAEELVDQVMRTRGYPVGDFEQRAAELSVNNPGLVRDYRAAHSVIDRKDGKAATTEEFRQALMRYRTLFTHVLGNDATDTPQEIRTEHELVREASMAGDREVSERRPVTPVIIRDDDRRAH